MPRPPQKFVKYHPTLAPEGKIFASPDLPEGWYETPAAFPSVQVGEAPKVLEARQASISDDSVAQYEAKFGKKPHHKMKKETIEKALQG